MKIIEIHVPKGIRYLSEWQDFENLLPKGHFILNKAHTGVGATQYFLTNDEKVILCSPRCSLIESKRGKHPNAWFYRDISDNATTDSDRKKVQPKKKATVQNLKKYNDEVVKYVETCYREGKVPKIMVTYDSLCHVITALTSMGMNELSKWTLCIDEFQAIFGDSVFKSLTEMKFLEDSKSFTKAVFLSATPFLQKYMEELDEFKNMPYLKLVWSSEMEEKAIVTNITIKKSESRNKVCRKIIEKMKAGKTVKFGTKEIDTKEAVFYINNVSDIIRIVKGSKLTPSEVNILCSKSNEERLKKEGLSLGNFPKEGEPHKMFTFATRSVFLGVDFYSECAMSYVFADPSQKTLALDISTDLTQILGRQRLDRNPYRNEAILFIKESSLGVDDKIFSDYIEKKKKTTEELIKDFNSFTPQQKERYIPIYRSSIEKEHYKNNYLMVVEDRKTNKPTVAFNTLYMLAELRAWEISRNNLKNVYSVIREQSKSGITGTTGTKSENPDVIAFKERFEGTKVTDNRIKEYCEFRKIHPELVNELDFVSAMYISYWDALGYDNLKALGFQKSKIDTALAQPTPFDSTLDNVILEIRAKLKEQRYEKSRVKDILKDVYKKAGLKKSAKAVDVEKYLTAKTYQDSKTGKRYYAIQSLYQKNITMFPFVWSPNAPMKMDIDRFLEIVKTGKYTIKKSKTETKKLKDVITEIRGLADHEAQGKLKREWLPVVCVNGTFKHKDDNGIESYSSFAALDFDQFADAEEMTKAKEHLKALPWVYAIFETPSGIGLKAIVLHDSTNPTVHWNLMKQLMNTCNIPETDTGVIDLSRGQFFSYDPNLWKNPHPVPFHFTNDPKLSVPVKSKDKYVSASGQTNTVNETKLDSKTSEFLFKLWQNLLTDDAVMERLDKHWKTDKPEYFQKGCRHNSMLIIAGTLCKAGIPKERTKDYLSKNFSDKGENETNSIVEFAYEHNAFGCDRRTYK